MIYMDGIIYQLQSGGGISVLFNELMARLPKRMYEFHEPSHRLFERYRDVAIRGQYSAFHSTYYRVPDSKRLPVITTVHDFTYERYAKGMRRGIHTWQKHRAIRRAQAVICVSESTRADLLNFVPSVEESAVVVIPNGVSEDYAPLNVPVEEQVLFVGARGGYKNFRSLVRAVSGLSDLELVCVGGGAFNSLELAELERLMPGRYRHAGFLTNEQLNLEYNRSLCLVYPSCYEGFGIPVLEAMRAGCPVIAVNISSIPEIAGDAALLLERGDPDEIAAAIVRLQQTEQRMRYCKRGLEQAARFSWASTCEKTIDVYRNFYVG